MTVVFSTYQSISDCSCSKVLLKNGFPEFDLIVCDEAHRQQVFHWREDESAFTKCMMRTLLNPEAALMTLRHDL